ncbi:sigma-70 family RNA polymerase sigma factor [Flavobacterium sp.]|uniref:RNA polymerase sigma factor n=1 Tax=Flavobacterium sp. TaxID=239 RepID=UPI002613DF8C|nr:sigma-70 family RNA polymerase sigma factor [Flavobacterium sp.]
MSNESNPFSDKVIVTNILNGNIQGFAVVVKNTEKLVTQIVRKMLANEDDQKDLVQDIYLKAYQNLASFQFKSKLSTWIANIAYNTTVNYLQKKKIPIIEIETMIENKFTITDHPEFVTIKTEAVEILNAEIGKLSPLYQTLITLYHLEELPNKEIAAITNLPEGTIKSYLSRARKILKDNINSHYKNKLP